jgi:hypothetical protein
MKPSGAHTHTEMGGGGNGWLVIVAVMLLAAVAGPVVHGVTDLIKALAITVAVLAALALTGLAAVAAYRARKGRSALPQGRVRALPVAHPRELEHARALEHAQEVHLHFHGVSAEDVAAILARREEA